MEELVFEQNQQALTTSKKVAWKFEKKHENVLRAIENLEVSGNFHQLNFELMVKNKELPQGGATKTKEYIITRDGFVFLVMGFTGKKAAKFKEDFIREFNRMEQQIRSNNVDLSTISRKDLAKMLWEAEEEKERLEKENSEMLPKAKGYDRVVSSEGLLSLKETANSLGYGRQTFINKLKEYKIFIKKHPLPYQRYIDLGMFEVKEKVTNAGYIVSVALVTSKGQDYLYRILNGYEQQKFLKIT